MQFKLKKLALFSSVLISAFALQACDSKTVTSNQDGSIVDKQLTEKASVMKSLDVNVIYLDRRMLPPNAVLEVVLEDVSKADAASELIASQTVTELGAPPYAVSIGYDSSNILDKHRYSLRATIKAEGSLVFTSTSHIDPFADNQVSPIEIKLDRVVRDKAADVNASTEFSHTRWELMSLAENPVAMGEGDNALFIQFNSDKNAVNGFSGCNNFMGSFQTQEGKLTMGPVAGTRKMCAKGMDQEMAFLAALESFASYQVHGETLIVKNNMGKVVARFESRDME